MLRLETVCYLIWARKPLDSGVFEVSREVGGLLQDRCRTSPYCPGELLGDQDPLTTPEERLLFNPRFRGPKKCPYGFTTKDQCVRDINVQALRSALFSHREVQLVGNYLRALAYRIETESIPESSIDGERILLGHLGDDREVWCESGPRGMHLRFARAEPGEAVDGDPFPWEE